MVQPQQQHPGIDGRPGPRQPDNSLMSASQRAEAANPPGHGQPTGGSPIFAGAGGPLILSSAGIHGSHPSGRSRLCGLARSGDLRVRVRAGSAQARRGDGCDPGEEEKRETDADAQQDWWTDVRGEAQHPEAEDLMECEMEAEEEAPLGGYAEGDEDVPQPPEDRELPPGGEWAGPFFVRRAGDGGGAPQLEMQWGLSVLREELQNVATTQKAQTGLILKLNDKIDNESARSQDVHRAQQAVISQLALRVESIELGDSAAVPTTAAPTTLAWRPWHGSTCVETPVKEAKPRGGKAVAQVQQPEAEARSRANPKNKLLRPGHGWPQQLKQMRGSGAAATLRKTPYRSTMLGPPPRQN